MSYSLFLGPLNLEMGNSLYDADLATNQKLYYQKLQVKNVLRTRSCKNDG